MDQVVQTNAAQTEELSSTAQSVAGQAHQLQSLVSRFKLGSELELEPIAESPRRRAADVRPGRRPPTPSPPDRAADISPRALVAARAPADRGASNDAHGLEEF